MSELAFITPTVLAWARSSARITIEDAAAKISVSVDKLSSWECGDSYPTIRQAEKLAKLYRRPFAVLFLDEIPNDFQPLKDFRTRGAKPLGTASIFIIREMQQKQDWLSEEFRSIGEEARDYIGRFSLNDDPIQVALNLVKTLGIVPGNYNNDNPIKEWIDKAENVGIFISRTSFIHSQMKLDSDEFQGFAISDPYAPFIFINSDDWDAPLLFTLVHELAHLWIAESGISNYPFEGTESRKNLHPVELFCNEVAANALMPKNLFASISPNILRSTKDVYRFIKSRGLGVSVSAFLVRAYQLGVIPLEKYRLLKSKADEEFLAYVKREEERIETRKHGESGGPSYYLLQVNKNGRLFTQVVLNAFKEGLIEPTQASSLLRVKVNNFRGLEAQLNK